MEPIVEKKIDCFDIAQICNSGQCFRMGHKEDNRYWVIAGGRYLEITQEGPNCVFTCAEKEYKEFWERYFDLGTDYKEIMQRIDPADTYLYNAGAFGCGIRILHQDLWEMIVSFLISQQNNIVRIRRCIQNICQAYGEKREDALGNIYYAFPTPESFALLDEDALKECNLGYRSKYVVRTAKMITEGDFSLDKVRVMPYKKAKEELMKLFGVGEKVADCICLFALHHMQAFPVDTHINQALKGHYPKGFPKRKYKGCEGVMQQYIFYYELLGNKS